MSYEAHITLHRDDAARVQAFAPTVGWSFSQIDGDPVLGKQPFCYLTQHSDDLLALMGRMHGIVGLLTDIEHLDVLRTKIELIVHDDVRRIDDPRRAVS